MRGEEIRNTKQIQNPTYQCPKRVVPTERARLPPSPLPTAAHQEVRPARFLSCVLSIFEFGNTSAEWSGTLTAGRFPSFPRRREPSELHKSPGFPPARE